MSTGRKRIERALLPYLPLEAAQGRSVEIARIFLAKKARFTDTEIREEIAGILGELSHYPAVPAELLEAVTDLVIRAWAVVDLDSRRNQ